MAVERKIGSVSINHNRDETEWTKIEVKVNNQGEIKFYKKVETVLKSHKSPYEKKIALFNCLKDVEVGELTPIEKERINFLLQSKLHGELAKKSLKEYERLTVEDFSKEK